MNRFLLSIIIPAYNCEAYIRECIRSVQSQLPDNAELVIVDDGSEDSTRSILAEYENIQENIRIYYNEHKGASGARNKGLDLATGKYVSFLDCDDCLHEGFLEQALPLTSDDADLYIFCIERIPLSGQKEIWSVKDHVYPDASDYADEYIRTRQLLAYSNCNKFYRRDIIEKQQLRFDESMAFGEDRLFNYRFFPECGKVITASLIMIDYIQRSLYSQSSRSIPGFFDIIMQLHKAKMDCFLNLAKTATPKEKQDFINDDLKSEIEGMIKRFPDHPEEELENLPKIRQLEARKNNGDAIIV